MTRVRIAVCVLSLLAAAALRADKTVEVGQFANAFVPSSVDVTVGEAVIWNFHSTHTTTSDATTGPEVWDSGILSSGSFSHTFTTPGNYTYHCDLHPGMTGVVNVLSASSTPTPTRTPTPTPTRTPTPTPTRTSTPTPTVTPSGPTPTPVALAFNSVTPCRVADTREANGPYGGPALQAGMARSFVIVGQCGILAGAKAVAFNVTVTQPTALGFVTLYPAGSLLPLASTLNYQPGQTRANNTITPLGAGGALAVFCGQSTGTADLIIDVTGYFE